MRRLIKKQAAGSNGSFERWVAAFIRKRAVLLFLFVILFSVAGSEVKAGIKFDAAASGASGSSGATSATFSHTVGTGPDRILIVGVSINMNGTATSVSSVTFNSNPLTFINGVSQGTAVRSELWFITLGSGSTVTANVVVTIAASKRFVAGSASFLGVNQTTTLGTFASASGTTSPASVATTTVAEASFNDVVVDTVSTQTDANSVTAASVNQVQAWNVITGAGPNGSIGGGSHKEAPPAGGSVTTSWTLGANQPWALGAVPLKPASPPTASGGVIAGQLVANDGTLVEGAVVNLSGTQTRKTITDASGRYKFDNVETNGFYTVTPARANYNFSPGSRAFSQIGNQTDAAFSAAFTGDNANPLDTPEYFVRQQYVDILGREPDEGGFNYWSDQILACNSDADCIRSRRVGVAAAFFIEAEFRQTGSFIYDVYAGSLGRKPNFTEYSSDRRQVMAGASLDAEKTAFMQNFVQRAEFVQKYQSATTAEGFVDALLQSVQAAGVDLSSERANLIGTYNSGADLNQGRALVVRSLAENAVFAQAEYNPAFVQVEYFGYLQRNPDAGGYDFWLNVISNREVGNYRGMVCAFVTSTEYQQRFSNVISHSNAECSGP